MTVGNRKQDWRPVVPAPRPGSLTPSRAFHSMSRRQTRSICIATSPLKPEIEQVNCGPSFSTLMAQHTSTIGLGLLLNNRALEGLSLGSFQAQGPKTVSSNNYFP